MSETQSKTRNADLVYDHIPDEELESLYHYFSDLFEKFLREMKYPPDIEYFINSYSLIDAIIRVDKRKAYFYCFHDMSINERKEAALYAYWMLKFKPFTIIDNRFCRQRRAARINEAFAAYIIYSILLFDNDDFKDVVYAKPEKNKFTYHDKLMYSLHYRAFTIDSMMLLVDSITPQSFEIVYDVES